MFEVIDNDWIGTNCYDIKKAGEKYCNDDSQYRKFVKVVKIIVYKTSANNEYFSKFKDLSVYP